LIDALAAHLKGKLFIYTSSIGVTDKATPGPERVTEETPCSPRTLYGVTKLRGEEIVQEASRARGFRYAIFRLATVYGPRGRENHVVDYFMRWVQSRAWPARVHWPGKISLVYVDDVVSVLLAAAERSELQGAIFYISNPEELTVGQMVEIMAAQAGRGGALVTLPAWLVSGLTWALFQNWFWRRLPSLLQANAWRLSLLVSNVFYCDSSKLNRIYPKAYVGAREGIRLMHEALLSSCSEVEYADSAH
jgi:UDP-glucose 4-epimerase